MSYWMIDAVFVGIIIIFALRGLRRGLVISVVSMVGFLVALLGAHYVANNFSHHAEGLFEPFVSRWVESAVSRMNLPIDVDVPATDYSAVMEILRGVGINENLADTISNTVSTQWQRVEMGFQSAVTYALVQTVARIFTFLIAFFLIWLAIRIIAQFLDAIAQLPLLNLVNRLGGLAAGLIQGAVAVWLIVFVLYFTGVFSPSAYENSFMLRWFG